MNVKRFVGKNAREAMALVRAAWGDDAVVLSNRPGAGGVEILAMPGAQAEAGPSLQRRPAMPAEPMSTVSFEQFVRERQRLEAAALPAHANAQAGREAAVPAPRPAPPFRQPPLEPGRFAANELRRDLLGAGQDVDEEAAAAAAAYADTRDSTQEATEAVMAELRSMRGQISAQIASLAWFDTVRRSPAQTQMLRLLMGNGFSPGLARHLVGHLPAGHDEAAATQWLQSVVARNLHCTGADAIGEQGGVFALVGPTGVGKTTTAAKIAAAFSRRHGAGSVALITADTCRTTGADGLRAHGRLLDIPVHSARDAASLQELLGLFERKKLVLIDTLGLGQRDRRRNELFAALPAGRVSRLLVLNAAAQAETLDEVVQAYAPQPGTRCVIAKLDEAVKFGAVVDVAIRRKLRLEGVATGQDVPGDWHPARAPLLARKALVPQAPGSLFTPDEGELGLLLTAPPQAAHGLSLDLAHAHA